MVAVLPTPGCSTGGYNGNQDGSIRDASTRPKDASMRDGFGLDQGGTIEDMTVPRDLATPQDMTTTPIDMAMTPIDMAMPPPDMASGGPITGGPCMSGSSGATAFRVRWTDGGSGRAALSYEVHGLPDKSRWKVGVYGRTIPFNPPFVDPFLGPGGVGLDSSDFIDVELSTQGVPSISSVTLSIYGRSYSTGSSGSFEWMTFTGAGATASNSVSNATPYRWYPGDATGAIPPNKNDILMRIKAGPSSNSLVVNRLELCISTP